MQNEEDGDEYGQQDDEGEGESNIESLNAGIMDDFGGQGDEEGTGYIGEFSNDYINAEIFKLFDTDGSGKITQEDLAHVGKSMGWSQ